MSMYGDTNWVKNNLYGDIKSFIETHSISELLEVVTDVIEDYEYLKSEDGK